MAGASCTYAMYTGKLVKLFCNKYALFCFCVWSFILLVYYAANESASLAFGHSLSVISEQFSRNDTPHGFNKSFNESAGRSRQECIHPQLNVYDPVMMKHFKKYAPVKCPVSEPDWVYVSNGTVQFAHYALNKHKPFHCDYYPIERLDKDDYNVTLGTRYVNINDGFQMPSDFFQVNCSSEATGKTYHGYHIGVAYTKERAERPDLPMPSSMDSLSIAILGFDSMSRMSWLRRLTKTRKYFRDQLGAIELEAHNIVGDGTTAVIFPMLTGKFEWELPECRRGFKGATTLDKFPFLWHRLKSLGYLTSWCNGAPMAAPFNWRMLGFSEQPTDFYTRPFYLSLQGMAKPEPKRCVGSRTQSEIWLNYFKDIFQMYKNKRKFLFQFITEFSHDDNNLMTLVDDDVKSLVQFLYEGNYLNNTLLILMGDHGARYSFIRSTWSGKLEERLPYFSFLFPDWFEKKYPEAIKNLRINTKRLTTPFDLYETFQDILTYNGSVHSNVSQRGISLFQEIPLERSCDHAGIAPHWCACLAWKNVSLDEPHTKQALQFTIDTINNYTSKYRTDCALLFIANVTMATKMETRQEVLKFKQTDSNGGIYKIDLSAKNTNEFELYQLTFQTTPGGGHFEVTVTHDLVHNQFHVSDKEISRINKYGNDPACILDKNKQIRQYCYCNNNIR